MAWRVRLPAGSRRSRRSAPPAAGRERTIVSIRATERPQERTQAQVEAGRMAQTTMGRESKRATRIETRGAPLRERVAPRTKAIIAGVVAGAIVVGLIAAGSRGFHWFDAALIGYAVATVFAVAAVTYKYTFWLMRPPTGRYFWRSWQLFFSYENFKRYTPLIPRAILDLFLQQFIRKRTVYRWITHQCIFWGVVLSCAITFPLTFGWLRFTQTTGGLYQMWVFGFQLFSFDAYTPFAWVLYHDLALIAAQRFRFDLVPLALLFTIVITGLALTVDSTFFNGAFYWFISLTHEAVVVLWLISLPFGKFFHII